jgi:hypothetical protein
MRLAMWVPREALSVRQGTPELREFELGGRMRRLKICGACHTHLWSEPPRRPTMAVVLATTLRQHREFEPVAHIWTKSALPWVALPHGVATYDTQPEDPMELVRLWKEEVGKSDGAT